MEDCTLFSLTQETKQLEALNFAKTQSKYFAPKKTPVIVMKKINSKNGNKTTYRLYETMEIAILKVIEMAEGDMDIFYESGLQAIDFSNKKTTQFKFLVLTSAGKKHLQSTNLLEKENAMKDLFAMAAAPPQKKFELSEKEMKKRKLITDNYEQISFDYTLQSQYDASFEKIKTVKNEIMNIKKSILMDKIFFKNALFLKKNS